MSPAALARIGGATPLERLASLRAVVPGRIVFTTSFGIEDQVITHFVFSHHLDIEVATLDTGRLFPATYQLWQETEERYGQRIRSWHPDARALAAFVADVGINGFYYSKAARLDCCRVRKVEPLDRALEGAAAWVTGLRADQSGQRGATPLATIERGLVKVSPLFDWTRREVADFCAVENIPVNPLHAEGYPSIGCAPCTRAVAPGEDERSGRWWWETDDARECGLHVDGAGRLKRVAA